MKVAKTWNGLQFLERVNRAGGRAIVGIGVAAATETKRVTHVQEGTLSRSVHVAPPDADHYGDQAAAESGDLMLTSFGVKSRIVGVGPVIEVGSWLEYACAEWIGRGHPGVTQGLEAVRGLKSDAIVAQAFAEEGLRGR